MLRRLIIWLVIIAGATISFAASSGARERRHIIVRPYWHAPGLTLSGRPCTVWACGGVHRGPWIPEFDYPLGENLQVTIHSQPSQDDAPKYQKPDHDLDTIRDLFAALRSCWSPPPTDAAREGMQMSVIFSFKKSGVMIAPPRMTFATKDAPADIRETYLKAINTSLSDCEPFTFTAGLGGAIAGRPIMIRYVDDRDLEKGSGAK